MSQPLRNQVFSILVVILGLWFSFNLIAHFLVEKLWFEEVGYLPTFFKRLGIQLGLWFFVSGFSGLFLLGNIWLSRRLEWQFVAETETENSQKSIFNVAKIPNLKAKIPSPQSPILRLPLLLSIVLGFCLLIGIMLVYYSEVALEVSKPDFDLPSITPPLPSPFKFSSAREIVPQILHHFWQLGLVIVIIVFLLINVQKSIIVIATALSLLFGFALTGNWTRVLLYFYPINFNQNDPLFYNDISFYVFHLPVWQLLDFWFGGLFLYGLIACSLIYLCSGNSLAQGKFPGFSYSQLRHLYALSGLLMLTLALRHWLTRYELVFSKRGVTYGASYTDVNIQLPTETLLGLIAIIIAGWLLFKANLGWKTYRSFIHRQQPKIPSAFWIICVYITAVICSILVAITIQRLNVQPNELARETPYIKRSIAYTRDAFDLNNMEAKTFNPEGKLTLADLKNNYLTIENIRLWDTRPLLQTNRQLQQIRLYYKFNDADIDRYTIKVEKPQNTQQIELANEKQQVIISARELDYESVPEQAKTWVNEHLIYTHGYGFTLSPVNKVGEAGLPEYFVKDIGVGENPNQEGILTTANPLIRDSIPIYKPRLYYGELTNTYILTSTKVKELDFPSGEDNVYNTYDGTGGIKLNSTWRKLLFAQYFKDWRMLFAGNLTEETKILFRRNLNRRVRSIAPFLSFDRNPYLVVADTNETNINGEPNYLYWIIDAYTTSDRYPYSDPGTNNFNYIRNSVKVVINAYNGDIQFYIADSRDPIIQSWQKIFPELFKPLEAMPANLRNHIRYPVDLFTVQSERLLTYHMLDPQVFYNREDQWEIPKEIYGAESRSVEPYYLIMKLPTETAEEFILLHPYTPTSRPNLIAWLAGRSDNKQYGKLLLYQFPKQKLIYGPDQIEALINQDPVISQQISLWNRQGSKAIQGNLLVIPIEQSLLYVEPLYLEAAENSLPALTRVIVVYENQIVMAETLEGAIKTIFEPSQQSNSAIVRPLDSLPTSQR